MTLDRKPITEIVNLDALAPDYFDHNDAIERIAFSGITFAAVQFRKSLIRSCEFRSCIFEDCIFDDMDFQRVILIDSTIRNAAMHRSLRFITGELKNCKLIDADLSHSFIQNVKFVDCALTGVDFNNLKAKSLTFAGGRFQGVAFDGANIVRGSFRGVAGLERSLFYNVVLDDCDFDWNEAFIVMEFDNPKLENLYTYGILPVLDELKVEPRRVDQYEFKGRITDEILQSLVTSRFVVAECTSLNNNVFFEIGFAFGNNKPVILMIDKADRIPFDLKDHKFIVHDGSIDTLKQKLRARARFFLGVA